MSNIKYWNFRFIAPQEGGVALIEAYYDKKDRLVAWNPAVAEYVKTDRKRISKALKRPVIMWHDLPGNPCEGCGKTGRWLHADFRCDICHTVLLDDAL